MGKKGATSLVGERGATIALTASAAIFGALVGSSVLDIANSTPPMRAVDYGTLAMWILVIALVAALAVRPSKPMTTGLWFGAFFAGLATAAVIVFTTFGFTRDHDRVLLRVDEPTRNALQDLCSIKIPQRGIAGIVTTRTLDENFVILDLPTGAGGTCETVSIPRSAVLAFQEVHNQAAG
jgi:hypothetical protein